MHAKYENKNLNIEQRKFTLEILIRCFLFSTFFLLENIPPFHKEILFQEQWLYSYPSVSSYVPSRLLYPMLISISLLVIWYHYEKNQDEIDVVEAFLCVTLTFGLSLFIVAVLKDIVGRPRPNFITACFPDGKLPSDMKCNTGTYFDVQSRKSFPSGHSAFAFSSMTFVALYVAGKMKLFSARPENQGLKLFVFLCPFFFATLIAISRICDYHHHWEDVLAGSLIGVITSLICYHLYYPEITDEHSNYSHKMVHVLLAGCMPKLKDIPKKSRI